MYFNFISDMIRKEERLKNDRFGKTPRKTVDSEMLFFKS